MKIIFLCPLLFAAHAYAHVPFVEGLDYQEGEAFVLQPPIEKSYAIYASFNSAGDQDRVTFTLKEADFKDIRGRKVTFNTLVPACAPYTAVLPRIVLIGPAQADLPSMPADLELPFPVASDQGVYDLTNTEQGPVIEENISGTRYFQQKSAAFNVTSAGSYEIIVWEPQGRVADYVLVVGDEEIFSLNDIAQSIKRLSYLRQGKEIKDENCRKELKP